VDSHGNNNRPSRPRICKKIHNELLLANQIDWSKAGVDRNWVQMQVGWTVRDRASDSESQTNPSLMARKNIPYRASIRAAKEQSGKAAGRHGICLRLALPTTIPQSPVPETRQHPSGIPQYWIYFDLLDSPITVLCEPLQHGSTFLGKSTWWSLRPLASTPWVWISPPSFSAAARSGKTAALSGHCGTTPRC
jgi:hypothetical protein